MIIIRCYLNCLMMRTKKKKTRKGKKNNNFSFPGSRLAFL